MGEVALEPAAVEGDLLPVRREGRVGVVEVAAGQLFDFAAVALHHVDVSAPPEFAGIPEAFEDDLPPVRRERGRVVLRVVRQLLWGVRLERAVEEQPAAEFGSHIGDLRVGDRPGLSRVSAFGRCGRHHDARRECKHRSTPEHPRGPLASLRRRNSLALHLKVSKGLNRRAA